MSISNTIQTIEKHDTNLHGLLSGYSDVRAPRPHCKESLGMPKEMVFVVEDEEDILELIVYNLTKEGYQVRGFTRGEDALRQARLGPPGCMVLDLMLPGIDGLEVGEQRL
jgi:PleD family two-component response regulator